MGTELFLGELVDHDTHERTGERVVHDADDLTTHGVVVGMTGSGKTGLGIVLLEEALRSGIPTLVLDPKGDMTNLALRFPGLSAEELAPWVPEGVDPGGAAATWKDGLASWGLGGSDIEALAAASKVTVYTPGSTTGVPLNLVGSLDAPTSADEEAIADEIEGLVSGLLSLVGIAGDPLSSREHILLTNLVARSWSEGRSVDIGALVQQVQDPPLRKLGVLELDSFYPSAERTQLALKLNGLLASTSFAAWAEGVPLDIDRLLATDDGVACSVIYLAHLSEEERQFVVTLVLSKLVTWMRGLSGTPSLRALVYMDEVYGYVPPSAMPPAKKPILTVFKQARAYGVGMVLSTQNPVDLDYKALSNAGTWMIGRLQTERDLGRLEEGLSASSGTVDLAGLTATIAALAKREFVLHTTSGTPARVFTTRWALDYLAGPLTRDQLQLLPGQPDSAVPAAGAASDAAPDTSSDERAHELGDDEVTVPPEVAAGIPVRWVDPAAPWLPEVGGQGGAGSHEAGIAVRVEVVFDDTKADLRHTEDYELVMVGLDGSFDADELVAVDYDDRDLREAAPEGAIYRLPDAPIASSPYFRKIESEVKDQLHRDRVLTLWANRELKLYSRPGESEAGFVARCHVAADVATDTEAAKLRARLDAKMNTVRGAIEREQIRITELQARASDAKQHEVISGAGDLLGAILGGRRSTRSIVSNAKGVSSRRRSASAAAGRVETALAKVEQREVELADLEAEVAEALADISAEWDAAANDVETVEVSLEKSDIAVRQLALIWVPVAR